MTHNELELYLSNEIKGQETLCLIGGAGSFFSIHIGDKLPLYEGIHNQLLLDEKDDFEGEKVFFIMCVWRIIHKNKIILSWEDIDFDESEDNISQGLKKLNSKKIKSCKISKMLDLEILFEEDYLLQCFADKKDDEGYPTNWTFRNKEMNIAIGNGWVSVKNRDV